jgi:hypothetical protein
VKGNGWLNRDAVLSLLHGCVGRKSRRTGSGNSYVERTRNDTLVVQSIVDFLYCFQDASKGRPILYHLWKRTLTYELLSTTVANGKRINDGISIGCDGGDQFRVPPYNNIPH